MRINTNINSMRTQEYMRQNQAKMSNAMDRLSSGKRINNASDDAAGLAIATRMRSRESGLGVAADNTQNGMALVRTADSAMNSVSNILLRMRDIANQSANGTNTDKNQVALQKEFSELQKQIDYIASNTQFNDKNLLDGSNTSIDIQTLDSADSTRQIAIKLSDVSGKALGIDKLSIGSDRVSRANFDAVSTAMDAVGKTTTNHANDVKAAKEAFNSIKDSLSAADAKKMDEAFKAYDETKDVATANNIGKAFTSISSNIKIAKITQEALDTASVAINDTKNATEGNHASLVKNAQEAFDKIKDSMSAEDVKTVKQAFTDYNTAVTDKKPAADLQAAAKKIEKAFTGVVGNIEVATSSDDSAANPLDAIKTIDAAIKSIADSRATLGATLNRLDFNVNNLKSQQSAMASSASQIEDADMAKEMSEMTKFKILNEAGISMLSQANQTPQMVSKLLQ
ncbi:flagellin N-terminal helical domain-containing protein [Bacillus cereus group sp. MYBK222-1]|uniref:flagellin N-terminal helical domain-containing protein n=1 Tax=Bacillus cereus group TaxID=86661 RepID=UPI001E49A810|nr:flagellin [Bacillus paranthracis]MCC2373311.1 flagellin [Bacillus paranthracis]